MAESVGELLARLRFVGGPVETIYLNKRRTKEGLITEVGAIESFTKTAAKEASAETPVVKIGAGISSEAGVTWTLGDPLTQVLVLRAALESKGLLYDINNVAPGRYIRFAGAAALSRPGLYDDIQQKALEEHPGLYEELEAERARAESILRVTGDPEHNLWLLTLSKGTVVCPAILSSEWLRGGFRHWIGMDSPWEIFALARGLYKTRVPALAAIHVNIKW
jgi:hypothetical protein